MKFEEIKDIILSLDDTISINMKRYIHYKSMRNFVNHFDEIKSQKIKSKIIDFLSDYIEEIKVGNYDFDVYKSTDLAKKYLFNIAEYYKQDANFMRILKIQHVFLYGLLIDSLLYFCGILANFWNIPIATSVFLSYYLFAAIFKEGKGRVYGMYY